MSFKQLYDAVQTEGGERISTKWLKVKAKEFSEITRIKEQWSGLLHPASLRGFYIEGPLGPPVPLGEKEALIVLAREMCTGTDGAYWRRFILTKELMHVFDRDTEKTSTREAFDKQITKLHDPRSEETEQHRAETKAVWRAMAVLCTEPQRKGYKAKLLAEEISLEVVATSLRIPSAYVEYMMRDNFEANVAKVMDD